MAAIRKILFIHQDELLARTLSEPLAGQGYGLLFAHNLDEALDLADEAELLLIDGSADPLTLCPLLKDEGVAAPLLLLASLSTPEVACVDERMAKPIRLSQLAARIEALLNRPMPVETLIRFAGLTLHPLARLVETEQGRRIPLTEKETAILTHLHQAGPDEVEEYRRVIVTLSHKVAAAHREHGQDISESELTAINDITEALNATVG